MKKNIYKNKLLLLAIVLFTGILITSCGKNQTEQPEYITVLTVSPTDDLSSYFTEAAGTIYVQMTETALANPTETPLPPTETPIPTATVTATVVPTSTTAYVWVPATNPTNTPGTITPSLTATSTGGTVVSFSCSITSKGIADGTEFNTNEEFDASWTIKNTGSSTWDASEMDYRYISGTEMHKFNAIYDLSSSVASGESVTIIVDMAAPSSAASYETYWGVTISSTNICSLPLKIKVIE
ncbi:MAG: hypothetical protein JEZ00_21270 [Anaerolineaceae bacterium]|nr:hypothetical protein [Anaerolineaceae bacterium]